MDYNFETLGDERFQKLCQAILVSTFPNLQCLPVDQPDGGRDAFHRLEGGFVVYQVKFSRNPGLRSERDSIEALIKSEQQKVVELIKRGATAYYLLTNVSGTSHLDHGSIDKVNQSLTEAFGIPVYCWWRDDLERRIEIIPGLIWRYPDIARGSDFLEVLAQTHGVLFSSSRTTVFRSYVAAQYSKESEVRFQQVQIQNSLFDLFTDTPLGESREKQPSPVSSKIPERLLRRVQGSFDRARYGYYEGARSSALAADWLLSAAPQKGVQRIVLEGAPGQGKSTVTQYMCQLHRLKVLRNDSDGERIPESYRRFGVRLPLRIDLRDYASWLLGKDPFSLERDARRPPDAVDALESFIAHQVRNLSGGQAFSADDVIAVLSESHTLIVLDGFDEVADIPLRARLIDQIRNAASRLGSLCASVQVIVTSRPAAFILSPGFPEKEWSHYRLLPMEAAQVSEYSDKWMDAKALSPQDRRDFKDLVVERTSRPHIKILSQNPMQLAILLWLISTKGRSLPDKRTALYDSYMDLFFGREAEKDAIVRDNRDVIVQIHEFIAWHLQTEAESEGSSGAIAEEDLRRLVREFLIEKEHPTDDILKLFSGVVERVGALVSRVQGTLEFEVQPLREYFAGKYLYLTAPYSPPGKERGGTKPDRFDALARRPYWSNVMRFYAGCYSSGELTSLIAGIEAIHEEEQFRYTSHALQIAVWLLNDWVFSQEPRTVRTVIAFLTAEDNLRLLLSSRSSWEDSRLNFPDKCGRSDFASALVRTFYATNEYDYMWRLGLALRVNTTPQERWALWTSKNGEGDLSFRRAQALGLFREASSQQIERLVNHYGGRALQALVSEGEWDKLALNHIQDLFEATLDGFNEDEASIYSTRSAPPQNQDLLLGLLLLNPATYAVIRYNRQAEVSFATLISRYGRIVDRFPDEPSVETVQLGYYDYVQTACRVARRSVSAWGSEIEPWSDLIESARRVWGERPRLRILAAQAAGIKSTSERASSFGSLLDESLPLAERARHARLRSSAQWWEENLESVATRRDIHWILLLLLTWGSGLVIGQLMEKIQPIMENLSSGEWRELFDAVRIVVNSTGESRAPLSKLSPSDVSRVKSERLQICLFLRMPRQGARRIWEETLLRYRGDDEIIIQETIRYGIYESPRDPKMWALLLPFIRANPRAAGEIAPGRGSMHRFYGDSQTSMPDTLAKSIMAEMSVLPVVVLDVAETRLTRHVTRQPAPLKTVAQTEGWFT